jgi:Flp pilus assembly protein CpaB
MKPRTLIPLVIGLGIGAFAIKMGVDMVRKAGGAQGGTINVLVSAKPIEVASDITESMLTTKPVAKSLAPHDGFTDRKAVVGRVSAMSIASGVPITAGMLAPIGAEPGLRAKIPPGYRAVSISVTEESAVAGFVMPGARVDVFEGDERAASRSRLLLSDVEVGAVGQSMNDVDKDGKTVRITKSVTLFLSPDQVELLPAAKKNLRLALRGTAQPQQMAASPPAPEPGMIDLLSRMLSATGELTAKQGKHRRQRAATERRMLEVVRGGQVEALVFTTTATPGEYKLVSPNNANKWANAIPASSEKSSIRE